MRLERGRRTPTAAALPDERTVGEATEEAAVVCAGLTWSRGMKLAAAASRVEEVLASRETEALAIEAPDVEGPADGPV